MHYLFCLLILIIKPAIQAASLMFICLWLPPAICFGAPINSCKLSMAKSVALKILVFSSQTKGLHTNKRALTSGHEIGYTASIRYNEADNG